MTLFDLIALAVIAISALMGYQRGAIRELVGLFAFVISAAAALWLLPFTSRFFAEFLHQRLLDLAVSVVAGFGVIYIVVKVMGSWIAAQVQQTPLLGGADRSMGLGIGAIRALILLGLFALVFDRATPAGLKPDWITGAFTYPLASASGRVLGKVAPQGLRILGHPSTLLNSEEDPDTDKTTETDAAPAAKASHLKPDASSSALHKGRGRGYDQRSREQLNQLLERTR